MKIITIILLIFSLFLSNCRLFKGSGTTFLAGTNIKIPEGSPTFKKGFRDGCETLLSARGNSFYRSRYDGFKYDPELIDNPEYKFAIGRGYGFCFNYTIRYLQGGADEFIVSPSQFDWSRSNFNEMIVSEKENSGFGINQSAINNPRGINEIFDFTRSSRASGGEGKGAMSSNIFYGTNHNYFGSFWHE